MKRLGHQELVSHRLLSHELCPDTLCHKNDKKKASVSLLAKRKEKPLASFNLPPEEAMKNKSRNLCQIKWSIFIAKLKAAGLTATALWLQRSQVFFQLLGTSWAVFLGIFYLLLELKKGSVVPFYSPSEYCWYVEIFGFFFFKYNVCYTQEFLTFLHFFLLDFPRKHSNHLHIVTMLSLHLQ